MTSESVFLSSHKEGPLLKSLAVECIEATLDYGATRHEDRDGWITLGLDEHLQHAHDHIEAYLDTRDPEHVEHALTRMAMAYYSLLKAESDG